MIDPVRERTISGDVPWKGIADRPCRGCFGPTILGRERWTVKRAEVAVDAGKYRGVPQGNGKVPGWYRQVGQDQSARRVALVIHGIKAQGESKLAQVVLAITSLGQGLCPAHCRQKQCRENRNDDNDDQEFDER